MSLVIEEKYRPKQDHDLMFMVIRDIDYVKRNYRGQRWIEGKNIEFHSPDKIIMKEMDIKELPILINDFVFFNRLSQPCTLFVYAMSVVNVAAMSVAIKEILQPSIN